MSELDMKELGKAVESVSTGFEAFKEANDLRLKEIEEKGSADPLTENKLNKINEDMQKSQDRLDKFELSQKRQTRIVTDESGNEVDVDAKALKWASSVARRRGSDVAEYSHDEMRGYKAAFDRYLRKDDRALNADEVKALSVGSDVDGGYVVHPDMSGRIVKQVYETSPMRAYASIQAIGTDALEGLFDTDEASASWVGETATRATTDTPELGAWRIPVHELSAKPKATQKILDDAEMNIESWLAERVADQFGRTESSAFCTGNGINKPRGFLTYADRATAGTFEIGAIEQYDTGVNGAFAAAPNGGDVLINALYALKAQYRANATWFMNRATAKLTRKLKDSDGAYLWSPGIAAGQPASILGYPLASFEDMADPATGSLSIAVGDMRATYQIVDRMGIRTLRDPYSAKPYVEFYTTKRVGGDVLNFESMKLVNFKA
jgi:HK97 family phage major capsid protein